MHVRVFCILKNGDNGFEIRHLPKHELQSLNPNPDMWCVSLGTSH